MRQHTIHPIVYFFARRKPVDFAADCDASLTAVDGNTLFPNAGPAVTAAKAALAAYDKAIDDVTHKVPGAVKARDDLKTPLKQAMKQVVAQVQSEIDQHVEQAATYAASAKMRLRKVPVTNKQAFTVDDAHNSGEVLLIAKAIPGAVAYYFEYSADGKTWLRAPDTTKSHIIIGGLTVGQTYYFRFHALTRKGPTDLSIVVPYVIR